VECVRLHMSVLRGLPDSEKAIETLTERLRELSG
jgi:hypothetical protein